jgi:hypothetical protein
MMMVRSMEMAMRNTMFWIVGVLVWCVSGLSVLAEPTQSEVDELRETIRALSERAKAIKDASDDEAVKTNARAIERIADVARTLGVELDGLVDDAAVVSPEPIDPDKPPLVPDPGTDSGEGSEPAVLVPGEGWAGPTATPAKIGDRHERAVAHWNVVPEQSIEDGFTVGVIAHHLDGVDRVEIGVNGAWVTVREPSVNPRTRCEEYWVALEVEQGSDEPLELRAIVYPVRGTPYVVRPLGDAYSQQDLTLYPFEVGEVIELGAGIHTIDRRDLPEVGWLTIRGKDGLDRGEVVIGDIGTDWHGGRLKFEGVTITMGPGGSNLRGRWSSRDDGQHVWLDDCRVIGNGPGDQTWWTAYFWETASYTDTEISDVQTAFQGDVGLVRNCHVHHVYEDVFRMMGLHVNVLIEDVDRRPLTDAQPGFDAPHPDLWQRQTVRDTISQDITAVKNIYAQGFFPNRVEDAALVRVAVDRNGAYRSMQIMGETKNLLIADSAFDGKSLLRGSVAPGERIVLRNTELSEDGGWDVDGVEVRNTIGFFNFGGSSREGLAQYPSQNKRLMDAGSWQAWASATVDELPASVRRVWLHNPFGLWRKAGDDDRLMWIDQWSMARGVYRTELVDPAAFAEAVAILKAGGVREVIAYVGSPQTLDEVTFDGVYEHVAIYLDAGCSIGFDATFDWRAGDAVDEVIQAIRAKGHRVYCEPWPLAGREYGAIDGWVMADRFLENQVAKGFVRDGDLAESFDAEQIVIQREWDAAALGELDATLAVRLWSETGRSLSR